MSTLVGEFARGVDYVICEDDFIVAGCVDIHVCSGGFLEGGGLHSRFTYGIKFDRKLIASPISAFPHFNDRPQFLTSMSLYNHGLNSPFKAKVILQTN